MTQQFKIGIIGAGHIADIMARTLEGMQEAQLYAIASRSQEKADTFAAKWNVPKSYGSYEELTQDPDIDLVYIATPHSHHYEQALLCLRNNKPVLCEKSFTANARQAEELIREARERGIFLGEAIWTRYMPFSKTISKLIQEDRVVGNPMLLTATLGYPIAQNERIMTPALCGGALLDLGVYTLNLATMIFGPHHSSISSACVKNEQGVDLQDSITLSYPQGAMAVLHATTSCASDRIGIISGDSGYLMIDNINNPQKATVYNHNYEVIATHTCPPQITGYEYEVQAAIECIRKGEIEPADMPHAETLRIMRLMDDLRKEWGVVFPADQQ